MRKTIQVGLMGIFLVCFSGCDGETYTPDIDLGFDTGVEIQDRTLYAADSVEPFGSQGGIAEGAILPLGVLCNCDPDELAFETANPSILSLSESSGDTARFIATKTGETRIKVRSEEHENEAEITVRPIAESRVELLPWIPQFKLPYTLWESGIAIYPDTNVTLGGMHFSEDGRPLGGFGSRQWTLTGDLPTSAVLMKKNLSDMVVFRSGSEPHPQEQVRIGDSAPLSLETISLDTAYFLELYFTSNLFEIAPEGVLLGDGETAEVEGPILLHAVLRTADEGKYIVGQGEGSLTLTDAETGESWLAGESPIDESMDAGRAALMRPMDAGESRTFELSYGDQTITFTLNMLPNPSY